MFSMKNLMVSTDFHGQGGIATVVNGYSEDGLLAQIPFITVSTHSTENKTKFSAITLFLQSILKIIFYGVFYRIGIVHVHMASRGSYTRKSKIIRLARFFGAKTIIHLHGGGFKAFYNDECSVKKQQHIRDTFNMADKVIVLSSQWIAWVDTIVDDKNKTYVVYNAVPEVKLPTKKKNKPIILFLGRLGEGKGVGDLINAFSQISDRFPDCELHLGGDGDLATYKDQAENLNLGNKVKLLDWVAGETKNQCLADATIYCLPSYKEGFPMGILEAMSAEVAVVATTVGGIPDAITHAEEGLLFEAGDVNALAQALSEVLTDNDKRIRLTKAAKIKYLKKYTPSVIIPQLKSIYQELQEANK